MFKQLSLSEKDLEKLVSESIDYSLINGHILRQTPEVRGVPYLCNAVSTTLFPSTLSRVAYGLGYEIHTHFNLLYHNIAYDHSFLYRCLHRLTESDDFLANLWRIYEAADPKKLKQPFSLCITRSDYMVPVSDSAGLKQIEFNTVAVAGHHFGMKASQVHRHIVGLLKMDNSDNRMPQNKPPSLAYESLVEAWKAYGKDTAVILFSKDESETNFQDIREMQYGVCELCPQIAIIRGSFIDVTVDGDGVAWYGDKEVAVIYYRNGYSPSDYSSTAVWDTRLAIELSRAIKCPSIHYQLAGMKKVQQELSREGVLEQFISDPEIARKIRSTFVGLYDLEGDSGAAAIAKARSNPDAYVLKPNREGGGNNFFGDSMLPQLDIIQRCGEENTYILMERIQPIVQPNVLLPSKPAISFIPQTCNNEFGVYGAIFGTMEVVLQNKACGHIIKTKSTDQTEAGICTGAACTDSPYLV